MGKHTNSLPQGGVGGISPSTYQVIYQISTNDGSSLAGQILTVNGVSYPLNGTADSITVKADVGITLNATLSAREYYSTPIIPDYTVTEDVLVKLIPAQYTSNRAYLDVTVTSADSASTIGRTITVKQGTATIGTHVVTASQPYRFNVLGNTQYTVSVNDWVGGSTPAPQTVTTGAPASVTNVTMTYSQSKTYELYINENDSNPLTMVSYGLDAAGMVKGSAAWDTSDLLKDVNTVLLRNKGNGESEVMTILQRGNKTRDIDGTDVTSYITSGIDGSYTCDVMVRVPKLPFFMELSGNTVTCNITTDKNAKAADNRYCLLPWARVNEGDRDYFYWGAYAAWVDGNNKLRSLSGKTPTASLNISDFYTRSTNNGPGYQMPDNYHATVMRILYLLKYGSCDSQTALGRGYVDGNSASIATGGTNLKTWCFGEATGKQQMQIFGIEDFWGNVYWWKLGVFYDASRNILVGFKNYNFTGSGYTNAGNAPADLSGYMNKIRGDIHGGFIPRATSGAATTYYTDYASLSASRVPYDSGSWNDTSGAGAFRSGASTVSYADAVIGARLLYV